MSAGSTANTTTVTEPLVAVITTNLTAAAFELDPIRLAEYTWPTPSTSPRCAPRRLETRVTLCQLALGSADTTPWITWSGDGPAFMPWTLTRPSFVPSVRPLASWLRMVHVSL